ncbi:hypothetical protein [Thalassoroseus pseudoceratinae]|uniref:hypothetical protein n=1 Tax=Thalassoroseus pseudoceratinae TaxID=2713176 RepID=UPI001423EEAF|nr:hypothetical protein [Thalassoroseus pseudoceratinae]
MKRSTIIATCLLNSSMVTRLEDGEWRVQQVFEDEFPNEDFRQWDREVSDATADQIVKTVGRAGRINVASFIDDLRTV